MSSTSGSYREAFICHRSTDKSSVVRPLVRLLEENGISCWVDEAEIRWGDSLTEKVNAGLRNSRYVVVVLSKSFIQQNWPEKELNASLNLEVTSGQSKVLPLLVGSQADRETILQHYPLLSDKRYMSWPNDKDRLVTDMMSLLGEDNPPAAQAASPGSLSIRTPKLKRKPSELDRHKFAKAGYVVVRQYFEEGLNQIKLANDHIEVDISDIHSRKFTCEVFVDDARGTKGKIWLGGFSDAEQLSFSSSFSSVDDDNSYNDWLIVSQQELGWEAGGFSPTGRNENSTMNHDNAAQHLWDQFIQPLEIR